MIDYRILREIQKNERQSTELSKIKNNFYSGCISYFNFLEHIDNEPLGHIDVRLYYNTKSCYAEICERRIHKLTEKAYNITISDMTNKLNLDKIENYEYPLNIVECEKDFFNDLIKDYAKFLSIITSK